LANIRLELLTAARISHGNVHWSEVAIREHLLSCCFGSDAAIRSAKSPWSRKRAELGFNLGGKLGRG
jgi:hypothetical protein